MAGRNYPTLLNEHEPELREVQFRPVSLIKQLKGTECFSTASFTLINLVFFLSFFFSLSQLVKKFSGKLVDRSTNSEEKKKKLSENIRKSRRSELGYPAHFFSRPSSRAVQAGS